MNETITLKKLALMINEIAVGHDMVNYCGFGDKPDMTGVKFPYLWIQPYNSTALWSDDTSQMSDIYYGLNLYVYDKIDKGDGNFFDVISDCDFIINTILAHITLHPKYEEYEISIDQNTSSDIVLHETDDDAAGCVSTVYFKVPFRYSNCNIPITLLGDYTTVLNTDITTHRLVGAQGPIGPQGFQGDRGLDGTAANVGATGAQGYQGADGSMGYQGFQGSNGTDGMIGFQGFQGPQGNDGANGSQGPQGSQGFQGNQGTQGNTGLTGVTGSQGFQGVQGVAGQNGLNGATGFQGFQGTQGTSGINGANGITGSQGYQGFQGNSGVNGLNGATGFQGYQGNQGFQGPAGINGITGSIGATGYQGYQGAQGSQGNSGINGITGSIGATGYQGFQGTQGIGGANGLIGATGYQGFQGTQGNAGANGLNGITGSIGATGVQGFQGTQGVQGSQGAAGGGGLTMQIAYISTTFSTSTSSATDFGLTFSIGVAETWYFEADFMGISSNNSGCKFAVSYPAGATATGWFLNTGSTINTPVYQYWTASNALCSTFVHNASAALAPDRIWGTIRGGGSSGLVSLKTAAFGLGNVITIYPYGTLKAIKLN
ncbi:MAG: hypothetical protein BGO69_15835 [Bacteroidetes bacterium 46-16]|nr:MAG: hypothetical protein BGO69_15835 [Bacteroidetes bacterium 46-16]